MRFLLFVFLFLNGLSVLAQNDWKTFTPNQKAANTSATQQTTAPNSTRAASRQTDTSKMANLAQYNHLEEGIVDTFVDPGVSDLLHRYVSNNKRPGYRIKIYSGRSSEDAKKTKERFVWKDRETKIYTEWSPPNFEVKIGNYRSKLKALEMLDKIKRRFRNAYIIEEWVEPE